MNKLDKKCEKYFQKSCHFFEKKKYKIAFRLLKKSSKKCRTTRHNLGYMYDMGLGTKKNTKKAIYWYKHSLKDGNYGGATNIGIIFKEQKKYKKAKTWFKKAYKLGDVDALYELSKILLKEKKTSKARNCLMELLKNKNECCEFVIEESEKILKKIK